MTNESFWNNLFCPHGYDRDPYINVWFVTEERDVMELLHYSERETSPICISVDDGVGWNFVVCVLDLENEFNVKVPGDGATLTGYKLDEVIKVWRKIDELKKYDYEELRKKAMINNATKTLEGDSHEH